MTHIRVEGKGARAHWEAEVQQWADACAWLHGPWYTQRKNVRERRSEGFALAASAPLKQRAVPPLFPARSAVPACAPRSPPNLPAARSSGSSVPQRGECTPPVRDAGGRRVSLSLFHHTRSLSRAAIQVMTSSWYHGSPQRGIGNKNSGGALSCARAVHVAADLRRAAPHRLAAHMRVAFREGTHYGCGRPRRRWPPQRQTAWRRRRRRTARFRWAPAASSRNRRASPQSSRLP